MNRIISISALFLVILTHIACTETSRMTIFQTDPLSKVMYYDSVFVDFPDTVLTALGESAVFQFVVKAGPDSLSGLKASASMEGIGEARTGWVHDVHSIYHTRNCPDVIPSPEEMYPDPIIDDMEESVDSEGHRTIIADFDIPRDAKPGLHKGVLKVEGIYEGRTVKASKSFFVKVYPVEIPKKQNLKVVNWLSPSSFAFLDTLDEVIDLHSDRYFEHLRTVVETGARYGQNCWLIDLNPDIVLNADSTDFVLDFTYYDKAIETLKEYGNLQYFCNRHFGYHKDNPAPGVRMNLVFRMVEIKDKQLVESYVPCQDPRLKTYIDKFYSQVEAHFRERGWLDICYQHIADEPDNTGTQSQKDYSATAKMVKKAAPGLRIIDASAEIIENQDVSVVCLGKNIDTLPAVPDGSERWLYTCCGPKLNFANRFVELPLIKTRILHWINYKYNEDGYLHWGFNFWDLVPDPMHEICNLKKSNWPGGDCFIIYPGTGKVYPSIRLCAMRDGIRDYDLLKMVEERDPQLARSFCDRIIFRGDSYNTSPDNLRQIRREMLEFLSK